MTTHVLTEATFDQILLNNDIVLVDWWAAITSIPTLMVFRAGILIFGQPGRAVRPQALEKLFLSLV